MTSSVFSLMWKYSQLWCKYIKIYVIYIYIYISHCLSTDWSCILVNNAGENLLFISFIYYIPTDWRSFTFFKRSLTHFSSSLIPGSELRSGSSCGTNCLPGRHRTDFHNLPVSPQTASKPQTGVDRTPVFKCTRRIPWYTEPHTDVSLGNCWAVMCVHGFVLWSSSADGIETQFKPWWRSLLCESDVVFLHVVLCWFSLVFSTSPFYKVTGHGCKSWHSNVSTHFCWHSGGGAVLFSSRQRHSWVSLGFSQICPWVPCTFSINVKFLYLIHLWLLFFNVLCNESHSFSLMFLQFTSLASPQTQEKKANDSSL